MRHGGRRSDCPTGRLLSESRPHPASPLLGRVSVG
jgi:hypothetical protein